MGAQTAKVVPKGKIVLAWHTNMASKWLDPQEHDGTATTDNFLNALHDALIKNYRETLFDHPGLAERYEFAPDAKSATFWLRPGVKFHNGEPVTVEDVKFSFENYRGAKADVLKTKTERIEIVDARTVRFHFKEPFLDFPMIFGTSNVSGAGWIVPAKYYQQVGPDGFKQKPIGAGPYKLVHQEPGTKLEFEAFEDYYRPVHVKQLVMIAVPEGTTRVAMLERGEADMMYLVPGELIERLQKNPKMMLAPVLSGSWWLEFPGFQIPKILSMIAVRQRGEPGRRPAGHQRGGTGRVWQDQWQLDQQRCAICHGVASLRARCRARQTALERSGLSERLHGGWLTPVPTYYSRGESVGAQLGRLAFAPNSRSWSGGCS